MSGLNGSERFDALRGVISSATAQFVCRSKPGSPYERLPQYITRLQIYRERLWHRRHIPHLCSNLQRATKQPRRLTHKFYNNRELRLLGAGGSREFYRYVIISSPKKPHIAGHFQNSNRNRDRPKN